MLGPADPVLGCGSAPGDVHPEPAKLAQPGQEGDLAIFLPPGDQLATRKPDGPGQMAQELMVSEQLTA